MAFAGPMRRNLIDRLVKIGVATRLSLASTAALFGDASSQLHSSSALCYPILKDRQNYSGSSKVANSRLLSKIADANLPSELEQLPNSLIVPLCRTVEDVLTPSGLRPVTYPLRLPAPIGAERASRQPVQARIPIVSQGGAHMVDVRGEIACGFAPCQSPSTAKRNHQAV